MIREFGQFIWTYQGPQYHIRKNLGEDDYWDRVFIGYLRPGETATVRVPFDPCCPGGPGGTGFVAWYASSDPAVRGSILGPDGVVTALHPRANALGENQGWASRNCRATRAAPTFNGSLWCGNGFKWPNVSSGGTYWVRIANTGTNYAPVLIRVWASMAHWLWQMYFAPPEDQDVDFPRVDAPSIIDPRFDYPARPAIDWNGYWYDGFPQNSWPAPPHPRDVVPNFP